MAESLPTKPTDRRGFRVAIICALTLEADMVEMVFDKDWSEDGAKYGKAAGDLNTYLVGVIAGHNVVLAYCSGIGSNSASQVASGLRASFTQIKIALVVGICGAVPSGTDGELGKNLLRLNKRLTFHLQALQEADPERTRYLGYDQDHLYTSTYVHTHHSAAVTCEQCNQDLGICGKDCKVLGCEDDQLIKRERLVEDATPIVHFGTFGSSNTVLKCGVERDKLAKAHSLVAFEMEGSGVWNILPTILIKAVCDYADSHKDKRWQSYAAAVAATGLKAILEILELPEDDALLQGDRVDLLRCPLIMSDMMNKMSMGTATAPPVDTFLQQARSSSRFLPFPRDENFVGREDILINLQAKFESRKPGYQSRLALLGMGGVGKSQIAIEYAYRLLDQSSHHSVFWIYAGSPARFQQGYKDIAFQAKIEIVDDEKLLDSVCQWLSNESNGQHTLILDNVDDRAVLQEVRDGKQLQHYLPTTSNVSILVTSRFRIAAVDLVGIKNIIPVEVMDEQSSLELLKAKLDIDEESEGLALKLIRQLERLPLAIVHAGAYIAVRAPRMTLAKYLELYNTERSRDKLLDETEILDNRRDMEATRIFSATWQLPFDAVMQDDRRAMNLLSLMSLLDGQSIPIFLLQVRYIPDMAEDSELEDALTLLSCYSLVTAMIDGEAYMMHRMVQLSMVTWMKKTGLLETWSKLAVLLVTTTFVSEPGDGALPTSQIMLPHASKGLNYKIDPLEIRLMLMAKVAIYLEVTTSFHEADYISGEAMALLDGILDGNLLFGETVPIAIFNCRCMALTRQGRFAEAQSLMEALLEKLKKDLNADPGLIVSVLGQLSVISSTVASFVRAEEYGKQALQICLDNWGPDDVSTIAIMSNYAGTLEIQGKFEGLEDMRRQTLSSSIKVNGATSLSTLKIKSALGLELSRQKKSKEAAILLKEALVGKMTILGSDHPHLLQVLRGQSSILAQYKQWQEAELVSREVFETLRRTSTLDDEDFWITMRDFLNILIHRNKQDEAERIILDMWAVIQQTPSKKHWIDQGLQLLLWFLVRAGSKHEKLERKFFERIDTTTKEEQISTMIFLSKWLLAQSKYKEAENLLHSAIGKDHPDWPGYEERKVDVFRMLIEVKKNLNR